MEEALYEIPIRSQQIIHFLIFSFIVVGAYVFVTLPQWEIVQTPPNLLLGATILPGAGPEGIEMAITRSLFTLVMISALYLVFYRISHRKNKVSAQR